MTRCIFLFGVAFCLLFLSMGYALATEKQLAVSKGEINQEKLQILNRITRHAQYDLPQPPPPPPPPSWSEPTFRKKREAKGVGGSMPTRKG